MTDIPHKYGGHITNKFWQTEFNKIKEKLITSHDQVGFSP